MTRHPSKPAIALLAMLLAGCGGPSGESPVAVDAPVATPAAHPAAGDEPMPAAHPPAADLEGRNRLGNETSPYLLQHQHNPVHWWPWGPEAFAAARALEKPIFLSIGYSTCYWCHVMERESFENDAIAAIMNEHFVCIKVDREERPDVDEIYMTAVQMLNNGQGGWPMSVFLEPDGLRPFIAGTYFPPDDRFGRPGFPNVLNQVATYWKDQRPALETQATRVAEAITEQLSRAEAPVAVDKSTVERALSTLLSAYDKTDGGFGQDRKFPMPSNLDFMMAAGWDVKPIRDAVVYTLDRMAMGGIYDHVGGGFHRYAVDRQWLVPHFEKMLYDNGQLATTYARGFELTGDPHYAEVLRETLDYVLREMTAGSGAFYSAQDAEVNHHEGENYLWLPDQIQSALTAAGRPDDIDLTLSVYGLDAGPNFQDPHHPELGRSNVLFRPEKPAVQAERLGMSPEALEERLSAINAILYEVRMTRDQPLTDDKVLTAWNGLMIRGFADAGRVLKEPRYIDAARRAADEILVSMRGPDGRLQRTARNGVAKIDAFLEDYANLIAGLTALARATGETRFVTEAATLASTARGLFWDDSRGGYFDTEAGQADLFVRVKSTYDGAVPSGNGVMLHNLLDLATLTGETHFLDDLERAIGTVSADLAKRPTAAIVAMHALDRTLEERPDLLDVPFTVTAGDSPVRITASEAVLRLPANGKATVTFDLRLAKGFHINAHEPGLDFLIPLSIELVGAEGLEIDVAYPLGDPFDGPEGLTVVHHGRVEVPVTVRRTGSIEGRPQLMITYQVCTDRECLAPETTPLPVRIVSE